MRVYNYSEARQNFAAVLDMSLNEGVIITRKDGRRFKIVPILEAKIKSPFEVEGIDSNVKTADILDIIREGREYE